MTVNVQSHVVVASASPITVSWGSNQVLGSWYDPFAKPRLIRYTGSLVITGFGFVTVWGAQAVQGAAYVPPNSMPNNYTETSWQIETIGAIGSGTMTANTASAMFLTGQYDNGRSWAFNSGGLTLTGGGGTVGADYAGNITATATVVAPVFIGSLSGEATSAAGLTGPWYSSAGDLQNTTNGALRLQNADEYTTITPAYLQMDNVAYAQNSNLNSSRLQVVGANGSNVRVGDETSEGYPGLDFSFVNSYEGMRLVSSWTGNSGSSVTLVFQYNGQLYHANLNLSSGPG